IPLLAFALLVRAASALSCSEQAATEPCHVIPLAGHATALLFALGAKLCRATDRTPPLARPTFLLCRTNVNAPILVQRGCSAPKRAAAALPAARRANGVARRPQGLSVDDGGREVDSAAGRLVQRRTVTVVDDGEVSARPVDPDPAAAAGK